MIMFVPFTVSLAEERVNTFVQGTQNFSSVAGLSNGGWVVTWFESPNNDPFEQHGLIAQVYDSAGNPDGPETVLAYGWDFDIAAGHAVAALPDNRWAVTYYDGDVQQLIFAEGYQPIGEATTVNTAPVSVSSNVPRITVLPNGGWVVSWGVDRGTDEGLDIYQRQFAAHGTPVGEAEKVNSSANYYETDPVLTALPDGGWVTAWASGKNAAFQRYEADGQRVGGQVTANSDAWYYHSDLDITTLRDGGWVMTWQSNGSKTYTGTSQIYQQRFDADGEAVGGTIRVNGPKSPFEQFGASVVALHDGGWLVVWDTQTSSSAQGNLMARRFMADGTAIGDAFVVNTPRSDAFDPWDGDFSWSGDVAVLESGDVVLTFSRANPDTNNVDIFQTTLTSTQIISGTNASNALIGNDGDDAYLLRGGHDTFQGMGGKDYVDGGSGHDTIYAGSGDDTLIGGTGNDQVYGGGGADDVRLGAGNDTFLGAGNGRDTVLGNAGDDHLSGAGGNDKLSGGGGADTLSGGDGRDTLIGGAGNDQLSGGAGNDLLKGGRGADTFVFEASFGNDTITGFRKGQDRLAWDSSTGAGDVGDMDFTLESVNGTQGVRITCEGGSVLLVGLTDVNPDHYSLDFL